MSENETPAQTIPSIPTTASALLDAQAVSDLLACSKKHVYRMHDSGLMPAAIRVGTLVRWSRQQIDSWIADDCRSCRSPARKGPAPKVQPDGLVVPERLEPPYTIGAIIEQLRKTLRLAYARGRDYPAVDQDGFPITSIHLDLDNNALVFESGFVEDPRYTRMRRIAAWKDQDDAEDAEDGQAGEGV